MSERDPKIPGSRTAEVAERPLIANAETAIAEEGALAGLDHPTERSLDAEARVAAERAGAFEAYREGAPARGPDDTQPSPVAPSTRVPLAVTATLPPGITRKELPVKVDDTAPLPHAPRVAPSASRAVLVGVGVAITLAWLLSRLL